MDLKDVNSGGYNEKLPKYMNILPLFWNMNECNAMLTISAAINFLGPENE